MSHYRLTKLGPDLFSFTSPLGRHLVRMPYTAAKQQRRRIKEAHMKRAEGEGAEAAILREHFALRS